MKNSTREGRSYSDIAEPAARAALQDLLYASDSSDIQGYQTAMYTLGRLLGGALSQRKSLESAKTVLVVSTAEDADFLTSGVMAALRDSHDVRYAVFWNNHSALSNSESIAPVVNSYYQEGYEDADALVIVKSVISGSCVVKTNLLRLMSQNANLLQNVHVASPVMHVDAEDKLKSEFPISISEKFDFAYFALDHQKAGREVYPGIGGQVYQLLGLKDQPAKTGYVPELIKRQFSSNVANA
ncbi:hypothetical protein FIU88_17145 [Halomonas sp. THAF12]|uniref:hypothetical protein n=1 Tax=Halomonas sp. THAF12 TaxID=2587849 RepID=UPI0012682E75|nr:hypothetical protein [Halomonas sp. THAF12]QFT86674.1 hypothetical protein FIU88_17145 [Halomonas sp. THAF12]